MSNSALPPSRSVEWPPCLGEIPLQVDSYLRKRLNGRALTGISAGLEYQLASGGKRFRPALAVWLGDALGADREATICFGSAVELLHNFFLIQDDIQDGDHYRRGRLTLWREIGTPRALNVADYFLAEAYLWVQDAAPDESTESLLTKAFTETFQTTVVGQALDLERHLPPDWDSYLRVVRQKTGKYLALPWVGSALISARQDAKSWIEELWGLGDLLGPAFQISDDVLDLSPSKGRGGAVGGDIREGKPSALAALAAESVSDGDRERWLAILGAGRDETSDEDVTWVTELYEKLGVVPQAMQRARALAEEACDRFSKLELVDAENQPAVQSKAVQSNAAQPNAMNQKIADEFRSICHFAVERGH